MEKYRKTGRDCEVFCDTGVPESMKFQITNHKYQTNNPPKAEPKFQTCFGHLVLGFEIYL